MEYFILYLVNLGKEDYVDRYDGQEFVIPAQSYAPFLGGVATHFLSHNPKLELYDSFESCQARLAQAGLPHYTLKKKEEPKPEPEPKAEAAPEPKKK